MFFISPFKYPPTPLGGKFGCFGVRFNNNKIERKEFKNISFQKGQFRVLKGFGKANLIKTPLIKLIFPENAELQAIAYIFPIPYCPFVGCPIQLVSLFTHFGATYLPQPLSDTKAMTRNFKTGRRDDALSSLTGLRLVSALPQMSEAGVSFCGQAAPKWVNRFAIYPEAGEQGQQRQG